MLSLTSLSVLLPILVGLSTNGATALPRLTERDETHYVELINNCGSGTPVFHYQGSSTLSSGLVTGPLLGGVAWLSGSDGAWCGIAGVGCGTVEFTLINPDLTTQWPMQNAINYSLLDGVDKVAKTSLGDHHYKYPMNFEYTGGVCTAKAPGQCTGHNKAECPGAFIGDETEGGAPVVCQGANVGIRITFC